MIKILSKQNSLVNRFIAELRDSGIQQDRMRFRRNLERIGEVFAYEISKTFEYESRETITPLGISNDMVPATKPVLATILRAGLPLHQGLLNYSFQLTESIIKMEALISGLNMSLRLPSITGW